MIRVVVTGVAGRMGQRLAALTIEGEGLELVGGVEAPGHDVVGSPVSALVSGGEAAGEVVDDLEKVIAGADVVIAFTAPAATVEHAAASTLLALSAAAEYAKREYERPKPKA